MIARQCSFSSFGHQMAAFTVFTFTDHVGLYISVIRNGFENGSLYRGYPTRRFKFLGLVLVHNHRSLGNKMLPLERGSKVVVKQIALITLMWLMGCSLKVNDSQWHSFADN